MRERKENEMVFFTARALMISFLSPLPIKGDKNTQKENSQIFILLVREDGAAKASSLHEVFRRKVGSPFSGSS